MKSKRVQIIPRKHQMEFVGQSAWSHGLPICISNSTSHSRTCAVIVLGARTRTHHKLPSESRSIAHSNPKLRHPEPKPKLDLEFCHWSLIYDPRSKSITVALVRLLLLPDAARGVCGPDCLTPAKSSRCASVRAQASSMSGRSSSV
jgi:hypothetical protein